jgi:hypothetical protein
MGDERRLAAVRQYDFHLILDYIDLLEEELREATHRLEGLDK